MFIFLDTETTGNGPDDRLCQIAFKPEVIVAHNAKFDMQMLHMEGISYPTGNLHPQAGLVSGQERCHPQIQSPVSYVIIWAWKIDAKAHDALGDILVLEAV
jgi:DNA polymerase III epsilon subunit-like protein